MEALNITHRKNLLEKIKEIQSINALATKFEPGTFMTGVGDANQYADYNSTTGDIIIRTEVQGTQYEGRSQKIESVKEGNSVIVEREPNNLYNSNNLAVLNSKKESLGNFSSDLCDCISPLLDSDMLDILYAKVSYVEPLSQRSSRAKKAILYIEIGMNLKKNIVDLENGCVVCVLGGDQIRMWAQKLTIHKCDIPLRHAKLLFEVYNRMCGEYESIEQGDNNFSYVGLDNLVEEILCARRKMKQEQVKGFSYDRADEAETFARYLLNVATKEAERYGELIQYIDEEMADDYYEGSISNIFSRFTVDSEEYYWLDQTRVTFDEWESETSFGFNHWYEIMELYASEQTLPFDLTDQDVVSILGFEKFVAFADLSYGC